MTFSLYDATIPSFLQILGAMRGLTEKAEAFCAEKGIAERQLLDAHLGEDMLSLTWQIKWVSTHSIGAIEGVRGGSFSPDREPPAESFAALRAQVDETVAALQQVTREEMESFVGGDMQFSLAGRILMEFTAENFLLSFSLPNFYFHASTAYDILRDEGLDIGKRDFLGVPRMKAPAAA
ncbi:MAG: DUF1993 family protein [Sphingobium sp.]